MHDTRLSDRVELSGIGALKLGTNTNLFFILVSIIDIEIVKTNASFLAIYRAFI